MSEKKQQSAPVEAEEHDAHIDQQWLTIVKEYGVPIAIGAALAVVGFMGYSFIKAHRQTKSQEAAESLAKARSIEEFQAIVNEYPSTPSAPGALLAMAAAYLHTGQYPQARLTYARFQQDYPGHMLAPVAELGQAYCTEAEMGPQEALALFSDFADKYKGNYLEPSALFGRARCLEQLGRYDEAIEIYETFIESNPDSAWIPRAETALLYAQKEQRAAENG